MTNREMIDVVLRMYRHCEPWDDCPEMGCEPCEEALNGIIEALSVDLVRCGECMWQGNKWDNGMVTCENDLGMINAPDDGFCSYGERRSDEERSNKQTGCD